MFGSPRYGLKSQHLPVHIFLSMILNFGVFSIKFFFHRILVGAVGNKTFTLVGSFFIVVYVKITTVFLFFP